MTHVATPGELRAWDGLLAPCPPDRIGGIKRLLSEVVDECPRCDEPVRRCDPRRLLDGRIVHLACAPLDPSPAKPGALR
jgi:hypothetical protein